MRADDFAFDAAVAVDDVSFGIGTGAVVECDVFGSVQVRWEIDVKRGQKAVVTGLRFVDARVHAQDHATKRRNVLLKLIQRRRFVAAGITPTRPEIQKHNFAAKIGKVRGLAAERKSEVFCGAAPETCFALPIVWAREKIEERGDKGEHKARFQIPF